MRTTHGMKGTRIYGVWKDIKSRCKNPNTKDYKNYGGRDITYDPRWEKFINFYEDMKEGYDDNLTIDRIDNDGNYSKENCRWITKKEQARNRRSNTTYKGVCLKEWCEKLGLKYYKVIYRITKSGWSIEKALELE